MTISGSFSGNKIKGRAEYWRKILETHSADNSPLEVHLPQCNKTERTISEAEVRKHLASFDGKRAAGLDQIDLNDLKVGTKEITIVLNDIIRGLIVPTEWKLGRTTMIEKVVGAEEHGDFRPRTISSRWIRLLNKILAEKLESATTILDCQKGFQKRDGVAEAIKQLTRVFQSYKKNTKPFAIALVDFNKAFDSVSHNAIVSTLVRRSVPTWLIDYIKDLYDESCTILDGELIHRKRDKGIL